MHSRRIQRRISSMRVVSTREAKKNVRTTDNSPWYIFCCLFLTVIYLYMSVSAVPMSPWRQEAHLSKIHIRVRVYVLGTSDVVSYPKPEDGSSFYLNQVAGLSAREYSTKFCRHAKLQHKFTSKQRHVCLSTMTRRLRSKKKTYFFMFSGPCIV